MMALADTSVQNCWTSQQGRSSDCLNYHYFQLATSGKMCRRQPWRRSIAYTGQNCACGTAELAVMQATNGMIIVFPIRRYFSGFRPGHRIS
jgi:hypothetical protein